jgi:hypothetical protein
VSFVVDNAVMHSARRLWTTVEPLHDVIYFAPGIRDSGKAIGLRGYWMTYFAYRAAPLGPVGPGPVIATFAGFKPSMVAKALPDAWSRAAPEVCLDARLAAAVAALRSAQVDEDACARAVALLTPVMAAADATGRALSAANAALTLSDDPVAAIWQLTTLLREHRGDGHVAALVAAGLTGLEAQQLQVALGRYPAEVMRGIRGWSAEEWAAATAGLRKRGLLDGSGLTDAGRELLADIEVRTDAAAWNGALAPLGEAGVSEVIELLRSSVDAVYATGMLPEQNPTGVLRA